MWDLTIPSDSVQANTLHTIIQTAKKDIREIIVCYNGTFNEHDFFGSSATLNHKASQVGFCGIYGSKALLDTFNPTVKGSLHFVLIPDSASGVYILDSDGHLSYLSVPYHNLLENIFGDALSAHADHTQYYCPAMYNAMADSVYLASTGTITLTGSGSGQFGDVVSAAHASAGWGDAHTQDGGLIARHIVAGIKAITISSDIRNIIASSYVVAFWTYYLKPQIMYPGVSKPYSLFWPVTNRLNATTVDSLGIPNDSYGNGALAIGYPTTFFPNSYASFVLGAMSY